MIQYNNLPFVICNIFMCFVGMHKVTFCLSIKIKYRENLVNLQTRHLFKRTQYVKILSKFSQNYKICSRKKSPSYAIRFFITICRVT